MPRWSIFALAIVSCFLVACGGSGATGAAAAVQGPPAAAPPPTPPIAPAPQLPPVQGEVIGLPGAPVPGLAATYVATELGWLGPDGDVVFEAVISWNATKDLGCGILRRGPTGNVNLVLMQGQALPDTGGGRVKHPQLPLEQRGDILVIPARVDGGTIARGLFGVHKGGGTPELLAVETDGEFMTATLTDDGTVIAGVERDDGHAVVAIPPAGPATTLCTGCEPGFTTDGRCVVVRRGNTAWSVELDGAATPLLGAGDPAPATAGAVTGVRAAWVNRHGGFVVHATTDDPARPEVLVRFADAGVEVLAACGAPAPGTSGNFGELRPAAGAGRDVVFGAGVEGDPLHTSGVFCAAPGRPTELLAATGDDAPGLDGALLSIPATDVVAGDGARTAFGAHVFRDGLAIGRGVFVAGGGTVERVLTTDAPVASLTDTALVGFLYPVRDAVRVRDDGRTLAHVGLSQARRPASTLGALLLIE